MKKNSILIMIIFFINISIIFSEAKKIQNGWIESTANMKTAFVLGALSQIQDLCLIRAQIASEDGEDYDKTYRNCMQINFPQTFSVKDIIQEIDRIYTQPSTDALPQKDAYRQALNTLMARKPKE